MNGWMAAVFFFSTMKACDRGVWRDFQKLLSIEEIFVLELTGCWVVTAESGAASISPGRDLVQIYCAKTCAARCECVFLGTSLHALPGATPITTPVCLVPSRLIPCSSPEQMRAEIVTRRCSAGYLLLQL